jgi:hypothetical protein
LEDTKCCGVRPPGQLETTIKKYAVKMRFERLEEGQKRVRISFIDEDGRQIMGLEAQTNIQFPPGEASAAAALVIAMPQLRLQNFGEYSIDLAVDGRQEASIPLFVRQSQPPTPPQIQAPEIPPAQ